MIVYRMYIVPFTFYLFYWRYAHATFAPGRALVPAQEKKFAAMPLYPHKKKIAP